jgi:hypothetical protein
MNTQSSLSGNDFSAEEQDSVYLFGGLVSMRAVDGGRFMETEAAFFRCQSSVARLECFESPQPLKLNSSSFSF